MHRLCLGGLIALAGILAACTNIPVMSERPLFNANDLALREGFWVVDDPKCRFKPNRPVNRWPDCAQYMLVRHGEALFTKPDGWDVTSLLVAAGDPPIMQLQIKDDDEDGYVYAAIVRSEAADGLIMRLNLVVVLCAPFDPWEVDFQGEAKRLKEDRLQEKQRKESRALTETADAPSKLELPTPFPGISWSEDNDCKTDSALAVRKAGASLTAWKLATDEQLRQIAANPKRYEAEAKAAGLTRGQMRRHLQNTREAIDHFAPSYRWVREARPDDFAKP